MGGSDRVIVRTPKLEWSAVSPTGHHVFVFGDQRGVDAALSRFEDHFEAFGDTVDFVYVETLRSLGHVIDRLKVTNDLLRGSSRRRSHRVKSETVFVIVELSKVLARSDVNEVGPALESLLGRARSRGAPWSVLVTLAGATLSSLGIERSVFANADPVVALGDVVPRSEVVSAFGQSDGDAFSSVTEEDRWVYRTRNGKLVFVGTSDTAGTTGKVIGTEISGVR